MPGRRFAVLPARQRQLLENTVAVTVLAVALTACSLTPQEPNDTTRPMHSKSSIGSGVKNTGKVGKLHWPAPPPMTIDEHAHYTATIRTAQGPVIVELLPDEAPIAVNNFVFLAQHHFYNNTTFHRIAKDFVIQGGDPTGTGEGGPGYTIEDEPAQVPYNRGTVIMSRTTELNSAGSQFFIALKDLDDILPSEDYAVFGKVVSGMGILDRIANTTPVRANKMGELSTPRKPVPVIAITAAKTS
jgi:cyclophilin family peptidyl-prolyl cis-trans isomerase